MSARWIGRVFAEWGYNKKNSKQKHLLKYTHQNVAAYCVYLNWVADIDYARLKFLNEATSEPKALTKKRGVAPRGD